MTETTTLRKRIIVLTGGGSGGHLYPLLEVADEMIEETRGTVQLLYIGPKHPLNEEFERRDIRVHTILAGKLRRYLSLENLLDIPKFFAGIVQAFALIYSVMPDAVFSKGGTGAFPVVLAARFYMIPIVIHESDSVPGFTNRLSAPLATRIGISFESAAAYFPKKKTAFVGNPIRRELLQNREEPFVEKRRLGFNQEEPLALVLGGSQGAQRINTFIVDNLSALLPAVQILHQVGDKNLNDIMSALAQAKGQLPEKFEERYHTAGSLDAEELRRAFSAADLVITRSGSGAIYECASFGKPALLIPLPEAANNHQRQNAIEYSKTGAAIVVEEANLSLHIVLAQIEKFIGPGADPVPFRTAAQSFFKPAAARVLASEILTLAGFSA